MNKESKIVMHDTIEDCVNHLSKRDMKLQAQIDNIKGLINIALFYGVLGTALAMSLLIIEVLFK
jgi:hypothetical protein